jgi:hypothetical protein
MVRTTLLDLGRSVTTLYDFKTRSYKVVGGRRGVIPTLREAGVVGSNPVSPTNKIKELGVFRQWFLPVYAIGTQTVCGFWMVYPLFP